MTTSKPARLRAIKLDELSLVDKPANPHARVTLFKRDADPTEEITKEMDHHIQSFDSLEAAVAHLRKHGMSQLEAMTAAVDAQPELVEKFNKAAPVAKRGSHLPGYLAKSADELAELRKAEQPFERVVAEIQKRDRCPRSVAMERAEREHPDEFALAYGRAL